MRWIVGLGLLGACTVNYADDANTEEIVLTRSNGSRIDIPATAVTYAYCEPYDATYHPEPAIKVFHGDPDALIGWYVWGVLADVQGGGPQSFPISFSVSEPARGALAFAFADGNETASSQSESTGSVQFSSADCEGDVAFTIDATLDSELQDAPPIGIRGTFRATVGPPP